MSVTVTGCPKTLPDELPLRTLRELRECFDAFAVDAVEAAEALAEALAAEAEEAAAAAAAAGDDEGNEGKDEDVNTNITGPPGGADFSTAGAVVDMEAVTSALEQFGLRAREPKCQRLIAESFAEARTADDTGRYLDYKEFLVLARNVYASPRMYGADLRRAAGRGESEAVLALMDRGCDPNMRDGNGWTSVMHAAAYARNGTIEALDGHPSFTLALDARDTSGHTAFMQAAASGHLDTCRLLKSLGADVHIASKEGRTALHLAASRGRDAMVKYLLGEAGLRPDAEDDAKWTALHCATIHGHAACAKLLVSKQAKLTEGKDVSGGAPVDYAEAKGRNNTEPDPIIMSVLVKKKKK